jgi:hypothetical protein
MGSINGCWCQHNRRYSPYSNNGWADISSPVATGQDSIQAHISLEIQSKSHSDIDFIKHHTHIYNKSSYTNQYVTIIEVYASNYIWGSAGNVHEQYAVCLVLHWPNWSDFCWYKPLGDINWCIMKWQSLSKIVMSCYNEKWILGGSRFWAKIKITNYAMNQLTHNR